MRVVITGGGTGGHVYPALAVAAALAEEEPVQLLYVGSREGMEFELITRAGIPFVSIQAGALRGKSPLRFAVGLLKIMRGIIESVFILRRFRPDTILATGGYVCVPVVLAGWILRIPSLIYLPDIRPGWAVKSLARFARLIAVTNEASREFLPKEKVVVTGYPTRGELISADKERARRQLGLSPHLKTLLVWGGSRGAHSINVAVGEALSELLELCQIIHISGKEDKHWLEEKRSGLSSHLRGRYFPHSYLHDEFFLALAAADLVVSRAGASVIGEFPLLGLPSILVPYPYAGAHQELNADVLVRAGAAIKLNNKDLNDLVSVVRRLLENNEKLSEMSANARRMATPDASKKIASLVSQVSDKRLATI